MGPKSYGGLRIADWAWSEHRQHACSISMLKVCILIVKIHTWQIISWTFTVLCCVCSMLCGQAKDGLHFREHDIMIKEPIPARAYAQ